MAVALAMATAMSTSSCASDSSLSRAKNCVCVCPSVVTKELAASWRAVWMVLSAWPAKLSVAPVAGDEEVRARGGPAASALASAVSACALEELAVVVVVSLVALVSERWSLSARRRAVLPLPLWEEEPPCAEVVSDALCVLSLSQGSGLCAERAVGVVQLALVSAAAAAAVARVAAAGTAAVLVSTALAVD